MKKYMINDFAKKIGVTAKALRYYEKYNIVKPFVDIENGYRYYTFRDAERIVVSKRFNSMGFSVRETSELVNDTTIEKSVGWLKQRRDALKQEAALLELKAKRIQELEEELSLFSKKSNEGFLSKRKTLWFIRHVVEGEFVQGEKQLAIVKTMMEAMPFSAKVLIFPDGIFSDKRGVWGLAIGEEYAKALGISKEPEIKELPAGDYLILPMKLSCKKETATYNNKDSDKVVLAIRNVLKKKGFVVTGPVYVIGSIDSFSGSNREKHYLVCVCVSA